MPQDYDKIIRENFNELLFDLVQATLGLALPKVEMLKDKLQVTMQTEVDNVMKVIHPDPSLDYLLHIEIQTSDEDMRGRNLFYYGFLYLNYNIPVKQVVYYIGSRAAFNILKNKLEMEGIDLSFIVIVLVEVKKTVFLQSDKPETVVLSILADFEGEPPTEVVPLILKRLEELTGRTPLLKKYQQQLLVLSRLRRIDGVTKDCIESMPFHYDVTTDALYLEGIEKGMDLGVEKGIDLGIEKGIEKGIDLGIEKGTLQGVEAKTVETALEMHKDGLPVGTIAKYLKITEKKVLDILDKHGKGNRKK
jgi:hypothetical protein